MRGRLTGQSSFTFKMLDNFHDELANIHISMNEWTGNIV